VATITDDTGFAMALSGPKRRVVSLVPSLTESVASARRDALVGATTWCTHPADLDVTRVRGTKNPDRAKIVALRPDLVLANKEENRRTDVDALRAAGILVWVTVIESVSQALDSLRRMFDEALQWEAPQWLDEAAAIWEAPAARHRLRVAVPIWRDPWMVIGARTFSGDLLTRLSLDNVYGDSAKRYPHTSVDEIVARRPDVVLMPDEPYPFSADDGPEAFPHTRSALIDGRALTWYGPSLVTARSVLEAALEP
jgi:ABC-type Fe3+-hydroxamate transport system substrate-binding protein